MTQSMFQFVQWPIGLSQKFLLTEIKRLSVVCTIIPSQAQQIQHISKATSTNIAQKRSMILKSFGNIQE